MLKSAVRQKMGRFVPRPAFRALFRQARNRHPAKQLRKQWPLAVCLALCRPVYFQPSQPAGLHGVAGGFSVGDAFPYGSFVRCALLCRGASCVRCSAVSRSVHRAAHRLAVYQSRRRGSADEYVDLLAAQYGDIGSHCVAGRCLPEKQRSDGKMPFGCGSAASGRKASAAGVAVFYGMSGLPGLLSAAGGAAGGVRACFSGITFNRCDCTPAAHRFFRCRGTQ